MSDTTKDQTQNELLTTVARDVLDLLICNCPGSRLNAEQCDGSCTYGMAKRALAMVPDRWAQSSPAFQAEQPWCGWTLAFSAESDWDTTAFGLERLVNLNVLLTTADGRSRPVNITEWQHIEDAKCPHCGWDDGGPVVPNGSADAHCPQCGADWRPEQQERRAGILAHELDTDDYEPLTGTSPEFVLYEDIREIVVY